MSQPYSVHRDERIFYFTMLGNLLGDRYQPGWLSQDRRLTLSTWKSMKYLNEVAIEVQEKIPQRRAKLLLPPLQITRISPEGWRNRL